MDLAYANEQIYASQSRSSTPTPSKDSASATTATDAPTPRPQPEQRTDLSTELSETFKAFSASPWGTRLGGFWGNVQKQSQSYYEEAVKEVEDLRVDAVKGLNDLQESIASRARSLSIDEKGAAKEAGATPVKEAPVVEGESEADKQIRENEGFLTRFKAEAAKRLKEVQKAEDAADEALLRFGTNITNFLRDAVAVTAPEADSGTSEVLFESKDAAGKRVIHTSRFDAQLHVIHTTPTGLESDPETAGEKWTSFKQGFDIDQKTDAIAADLEKYPELRKTMGELVPEKVEYKDFWTRYYFLRHVLEAQEETRRELLKASAKANDDEEVGWDSDDDDEQPSKPAKLDVQNANDSTTTLSQAQATPKPTGSTLEPGRRSHDEKSVADSEASYDIVSGAPSRAASSPKEKKAEESEDEDWE
ncbi:uncharacterized protein HMPREF1541_05460 [Cyphellophora europaea CBS 101466]|uniref:BSD domain-containing protein n=1 Tax=Cyphellophora europaea (strain CBS 101466) TaxID=1220924 RepID=W2RRZ9_CYPE1|nr:uncharacterized protein HMPREF1541_05460 [Cyphellophora europaea CBS 101466]ETN39237.1 hypothetical protein HMPREF1541_05460 [Cyphellophora europaea CBS 101466]